MSTVKQQQQEKNMSASPSAAVGGAKPPTKISRSLSLGKTVTSKPGGKTSLAPPGASTVGTSKGQPTNATSSSSPTTNTAIPSSSPSRGGGGNGGRIASGADGNNNNNNNTAATPNNSNDNNKGGMTFVTSYGKWNQSEIEKYFEFLCHGEVGDQISCKALEKLVKELHIEWMSFEMFVLMWKLGATRRSVSRGEWNLTMYDHSITHPLQLRSKIPEWVNDVRQHGEVFTEMYNFLFDFVRDENPRWLDPDKAVAGWKVLLPASPIIQQWCSWVKEVKRCGISRDVWQQIWALFSTTPELENYNLDGKWPSLIDDFVDWYKRGSVGVEHPK